MPPFGSCVRLVAVVAGLVVGGLTSTGLPVDAQSSEPALSNIDLFALASPQQVAVGNEVIVYVTLTNLGPDVATGITVATTGEDEDIVPLGGTGAACSVVDGAISCDVAELGVGEVVEIEARFDVLDDGEHGVHAQVTAEPLDPNADNDSTRARFRAVTPGDVFAWGWNSGGQLGDGTGPVPFPDVRLPARVAGIEDVVQIAGGEQSSAYLDSQGRVWVHGRQFSLEPRPSGPPALSFVTARTPRLVPGLPRVRQVDANDFGYVALGEDGSVWVWGVNFEAPYGDGGPAPFSSPNPVRVVGLPAAIVAISSGPQPVNAAAHVLALAANGEVWSWGENGSGQLGHDVFAEPLVPAPVVGLPRAVAVDASGHTSVALDEAGRAWVWGRSLTGSGGLPCADSSVLTCDPTPSMEVELADASRAVIGADDFALAYTAAGPVSWGAECLGRLGRGAVHCDPTPFYDPAPIADDTREGIVAAGQYHAMGLRDDGIALAWGGNDRGQLGDDSTANRGTADVVDCLDQVRDVAAGSFASFAIVAPDRQSPQVDGVSLQEGPVIVSPVVHLEASAHDARTCVRFMRASNSPSVDGSGQLVQGRTTPYASTTAWDITDPSTGGHAAAGIHTIHVQFQDRARNWSPVTSVTVEFRPDHLPPTVTGVPDREPDANEWYRAPVTIDWIVTDPDPSSGTPNDPSDTLASLEGSHLYTSDQSCDPAGNCATGEIMIALDLTPPSIDSISIDPPTPTTQTETSIVVTATDVLSGLAGGEWFLDGDDPGVGLAVPMGRTEGGLREPLHMGLNVGSHTVSVRAMDNAGNWSSAITLDFVVAAHDTEPPVVTGIPDREPNASGWYRDDVYIDWQAIDPEPSSGTPTDPPDTTVSGVGADLIVESDESCDPAGNCATGQVTLSIDRSMPEVMHVLLDPSTTHDPGEEIEITAPALDDLSGIARGEWFLDGHDPGVGEADELEWDGTRLRGTIPAGLAPGSYEVHVRARDAAGNWSSPVGAPLEIEVSPDQVAPVVTGVPDREPNDAGWYRAPVDIDWDAVDPDPSSGTPTDPPDTTADTEGEDVIYTSAESCDPAGNCAIGELRLSIDMTPPDVRRVTVTEAIELGHDGSIKVRVEDALSGVARGEWFLDDEDPGTGDAFGLDDDPESDDLVATIPEGLALGEHTISVRVRDRAGNWSEPTRRSLNVTEIKRERGCDLRQDRSESATAIQLFEEQGEDFARLCRKLTVDITEPGAWGRDTYDPAAIRKAKLAPGTIERGRVRSYLVHVDRGYTITRNGDYLYREVVLEFSRPVLGIAVRDEALDASDILGAPGTTYPTGHPYRGLEVNLRVDTELINRDDTITLSADRTRVRIITQLSEMDQIRIITDPDAEIAGSSVGYFDAPPPPSLALDTFDTEHCDPAPPNFANCKDERDLAITDDDVAVIFEQEVQDIVLAGPLAVDLKEARRYTVDSPPPGGLTIGAGQRIRSVILHVDRPGDFDEFEDGDFARFRGSIRFDTPILGVITSDQRLDQSDDLLGGPGWVYGHGDDYRGLDFEAPATFGRDELIRISDDRRTLVVETETGNGLDELRVILEAP